MTADTQQIPDIAATPAWQALQRHHDEIGGKTLRELFAEDPERGTQLALSVGDLYIDYSKHRVTRETLKLLLDLARTARLEQHRDAMFSGVHINTSENRAVLHTALRAPVGVESPPRRGRRAGRADHAVAAGIADRRAPVCRSADAHGRCDRRPARVPRQAAAALA